MEGAHRALALALSLAAGLSGCSGLRLERVFAQRLSARAAAEQLARGETLLIDLRRPDDYEREHIPGAVSIPARDLGESRSRLPDEEEAPILVYDEDGRISEDAALWLIDQGYDCVGEISGGVEAWRQARLPLTGGARRPEDL